MVSEISVKIYPRPESGDRPSLLYPRYVGTVRRAPAMPPIPAPHTLSQLCGADHRFVWSANLSRRQTTQTDHLPTGLHLK